MAKPIHDYICAAHGKFESRTGKCPHGCSEKMVQKVFLKAPGMVTGRTRGIDATLQGLADEHGLTDMNNQNGTSSVFRPPSGMDRTADEMRRLIMSGQTYSAGIGSGEGAIQQTLQDSGFKGDNALNDPVVSAGLAQKPKVNVFASYNPKELPKGDVQ